MAHPGASPMDPHVNLVVDDALGVGPREAEGLIGVEGAAHRVGQEACGTASPSRPGIGDGRKRSGVQRAERQGVGHDGVGDDGVGDDGVGDDGVGNDGVVDDERAHHRQRPPRRRRRGAAAPQPERARQATMDRWRFAVHFMTSAPLALELAIVMTAKWTASCSRRRRCPPSRVPGKTSSSPSDGSRGRWAIARSESGPPPTLILAPLAPSRLSAQASVRSCSALGFIGDELSNTMLRAADGARPSGVTGFDQPCRRAPRRGATARSRSTLRSRPQPGSAVAATAMAIHPQRKEQTADQGRDGAEGPFAGERHYIEAAGEEDEFPRETAIRRRFRRGRGAAIGGAQADGERVDQMVLRARIPPREPLWPIG